MRYLWQQPVQLAGTRVAELLGREPHTPLDDAVEAALLGLGCLPPSPAEVAALPHDAASGTPAAT